MTSLCPLNFFSAGKVLLSSGGTFLLPRCHLYGGVTKIRNADDELVPVDPENFPQDGVEVLLSYPEGTDSSYIFVITHMITSGEHAGEIEVLNYRAEADGLRVHFTSMSPVCVAYQAGSSSTVTITVGDTTSQSGSNPATGAAGGQTLPVLLWGGALVMALAVPKKRK